MIFTRISPPDGSALDRVAAAYDLPPAEVVRLMIQDALLQDPPWTPTAAMDRIREAREALAEEAAQGTTLRKAALDHRGRP